MNLPSRRQSSWDLFQPRRRKSHLRTGNCPPVSMSGRNRTQLGCIHEEQINKSSDFFQRVTWEILDRSIFILVNKIKNTQMKNLPHLKNQLIYLNMISGKGLFCRYIIQAQLKSTNNTHKYALLASLVNCEFNEVGMLLLKRCVHIFFCGYRSQTNDKLLCFPILKLIAHLINYRVGDPILAVELVKMLLKSPTEESVNMAYSIIHICGHKMRQMYAAEMDKIADKNYSEDKTLDSAIEFKLSYTISHVIKTNKYSVVESADLIQYNEKHVHLFKLNCLTDSEEYHDYYFHKPECENDIYRLYYEQFILKGDNKAEYILLYDTNDGYNYFTNGKRVICDVNNNMENMRLIRNIIYQIVMSPTFDYITSALQLMQLKMKPGQETELSCILIDLCCGQNINNEHLERLGHVTQILCQLDEFIVGQLERMFVDNFLVIHGFSVKQIRNVSTFFAHLLCTDTINWDVVSAIQLTKATLIPSNMLFVRYLLYEMMDHIGYKGMAARMYNDLTISMFEGVFLRDGSINFFTSNGLEKLFQLYLDCRDSIKCN